MTALDSLTCPPLPLIGADETLGDVIADARLASGRVHGLQGGHRLARRDRDIDAFAAYLTAVTAGDPIPPLNRIVPIP